MDLAVASDLLGPQDHKVFKAFVVNLENWDLLDLRVFLDPEVFLDFLEKT